MTRRKGEPSGTCTVCKHPEKTRIELLVIGGASQRSVGKKYGVSNCAISRHLMTHVSDERKASLVMGPVKRMALAAQVAEESSSVLDHLRSIRAGLYSLYEAAVTAGDGAIGALIAGRLHENLGKMAQLTGQLAQSPLVQVNQTNVFINDPSFMQFQQQLIGVLRRFPDARNAVVAEFERLERSLNEQAPAGITYEHEENAA